MARIAGVNIPNHQHAEIALTAIYGIGRSRAQKICDAVGVARSTKMKDLTEMLTALAMAGVTKEEITACVEQAFTEAKELQKGGSQA